MRTGERRTRHSTSIEARSTVERASCQRDDRSGLLALQRAAGNRAVAGLLAEQAKLRVAGPGEGGFGASHPLVVQRQVGKDDLWDDYYDAYWSLMDFTSNKRGSKVDEHWLDIFHNLEAKLYGAKSRDALGGGGANPYDADDVQGAHTALSDLGFVAPARGRSPEESSADALVMAANARWRKFTSNRLLNRGAWAGSATHGAQPGDYVQTAAMIIQVLRRWAAAARGRIQNWWIMQSDSAPSGWSLHRTGADGRGDFIYHL